jgi:hypothetical protein
MLIGVHARQLGEGSALPSPLRGGERVSVAAMLRSNAHMTTFMESIVYSAKRGPNGRLLRNPPFPAIHNGGS